ncbi:Single-minded [Trichinella spiralis]|uniref:Single-minded n=1 Tax=Trichinella spiralis TaxID=6334 RepID=A0ABR3KNR7_TRISP
MKELLTKNLLTGMPVLHCSSRMKFFQYAVDEKLYGSLYGVGAPAKYLVLTNQQMTSSETKSAMLNVRS